MGQMIVRNIPDTVHAALKRVAEQNLSQFGTLNCAWSQTRLSLVGGNL